MRGEGFFQQGSVNPAERHLFAVKKMAKGGSASFGRTEFNTQEIQSMSLRLTPDIIEGAYEFLRMTPPFRGWRLPPADEVEFVVSRHKRYLGYHRGLKHKVNSHE